MKRPLFERAGCSARFGPVLWRSAPSGTVVRILAGRRPGVLISWRRWARLPGRVLLALRAGGAEFARVLGEAPSK